MSLFQNIAEPLIDRGIPIIPLRPRTKIAFLPNWESLASTDPFQIAEWSELYNDANAACVALAKPTGIWFFEVDKPEVIQRIETDTGQKMPKTFRVRSSPGRGHFYFKQNNLSLSMGNIAQGFVKGADWSARVDREYVVAPGSLHPITGKPYEVVSTAAISEAPEWLISWLVSQKQTPVKNSDDGVSMIPRGAHDSTLTSIAGTLRNQGLDAEEMESILISICERRCVNYGPDYKEMCGKIAHSVSRYKPGIVQTVTVAGRPPGENAVRPNVYQAPHVQIQDVELVFKTIPYPTFPQWIMGGTSLYEGFAKPYCEKNSRYPEFMWMPAMAILLNYIGTRVKISHNKNLVPSIYLALIGRRGEVIKSSSVEDAIRHFHNMQLAEHGSNGGPLAEGKSMIWTAGSPEGFGIEMCRTNCHNGILFYDELSTLTNKASIESSTLSSTLLTLYESGKVSNLVKSKKEVYSLEPGTYCVSLIVCSTDKNFQSNWSKLAGKSSGLDDRFFFLYQPEKFKKRTPQVDVNTYDGSLVTRKLIDKAVAKGEYKVTDLSPLSATTQISNRTEIRAEKFALGFAIDLDRDEIDEDCIERALALVAYEQQVKKYLAMYESYSKEGAIQMEIIHHVQRSSGRMTVKEINKIMRPERYGTFMWNSAYNGLIKNGWMAELGTGTLQDPATIVLLKVPEDEDE